MFHLQWPLVHHCWHVESSKGRMHFLEEYISTCCTQEGFSRNILIKNIFLYIFFQEVNTTTVLETLVAQATQRSMLEPSPHAAGRSPTSFKLHSSATICLLQPSC